MTPLQFWAQSVGLPQGTPGTTWEHSVNVPGAFAQRAREIEEAGFDGISVPDTQNKAADCYVSLGLAVHATSRLLLGTGVTNPFTRHPAVTASAIGALQAESNGRAVLGIGRGDSALAYLGRAPVKLGRFQSYLEEVQAYLRNEDVPFEPDADAESLSLADRPRSSRINWFTYPRKVPVDVAATGPRVIAIAAQTAERVTFALGADPRRLAWGIEVAREAMRQVDRDPREVSFGAYVNLVVADDSAQAFALGGPGLASFARFSAMHGRVVGPTSEHERRVLHDVQSRYNMLLHARPGSAQEATLDATFVDEFAIFGDPEYCLERLQLLVKIGISRFVIVGPSIGVPRVLAAESEMRLAEDVIPKMRMRNA